MCHRIREAMKREPLASKFTGTVVADETWIGGDPKIRKRGRRWDSDYNAAQKSTVFSLVHPESGEVQSRVVPNVKRDTLRGAIEEEVDLPETDLHTDHHQPYIPIGWQARSHGRVNHAMSEYVRDGISTNQAESYFAQLKRSLDGTYHHVSREHLPRYLAEFDYRHSTRKMPDGVRTAQMIQNTMGRRLTFRPVASSD